MVHGLIHRCWDKVTSLFNRGGDAPPTEIPSFPPPQYTPARAQPVSSGHTARQVPVINPINPPPYTNSCDTLPLYTADPHYPIPESSTRRTRVLVWTSLRRETQSTLTTPYISTRSSSTALPGRLRRSELVHPHVKRQYVLVMAGICAIAVVLIVIKMKRSSAVGDTRWMKQN